MTAQPPPINVLSYGGGINSSALFFYLMDKKMPLDVVIFADTGEESPETYDAVNRMTQICKQISIPFITVKSEYGNLYDYYMTHKAVPSMMRRDCTSKFKISPIRKYLRQAYGKEARFVLYIGITYEEGTRVRDSDVKYITNAYPFVDAKITRAGNQQILAAHSFKAIKSGCKGCIFNRKSTWIKMLLENPSEFERHMLLEENGSRYPQIYLNGSYSLRSLKETYEKQKSLMMFSEDQEPSCKVYGGCFL